MEARDLKDQWVTSVHRGALVTPDPLDLLDLRAAPVSLASRDNWVTSESLGSKERLDQRENLVRKVPRAYSDPRARRGRGAPEETQDLWGPRDLWERGALPVTEASQELTVCPDKRELRETAVSLVLLVLKVLWETRDALGSLDCPGPGV